MNKSMFVPIFRSNRFRDQRRPVAQRDFQDEKSDADSLDAGKTPRTELCANNGNLSTKTFERFEKSQSSRALEVFKQGSCLELHSCRSNLKSTRSFRTPRALESVVNG